MQITIEYDSIWQNSFLAGSDDQPISKKNNRKFIATSKSKDHSVKEITKNTVLGVLCRLIGDQRKLYQIRESKDYYFRDIENLITHQNKGDQTTKETVFIVNKSNSRPPQSTFIGVLPDDTKLFFSDSAPQLWSVLYLEFNDLVGLIKNEKVWESKEDKASSLPRNLLFRIDEITNQEPVKTIEREVKELTEKINKEEGKQKELTDKFQARLSPNEKQKKAFGESSKKILVNIAELNQSIIDIEKSGDRNQFDTKLKSTVAFLDEKYPDKKAGSYLKDGVLYPIKLYAAALYLQAERMREGKIFIDYCYKKDKVSIQGFSKRGFNGVRDFLNLLCGSKKKTVGTPFPLTKSSGTLEINIRVDRDKAKEIKTMIENAGVSSFYLGKKGLAYVTYIGTREA